MTLHLPRRRLLGGLLGLIAAPAIVRAESLMRVAAPKPSSGLSLADWRYGVRICNIRTYGRSPMMGIIELLTQQNEIMRDMMWREGEPAFVRVSLPAQSWRASV